MWGLDMPVGEREGRRRRGDLSAALSVREKTVKKTVRLIGAIGLLVGLLVGPTTAQAAYDQTPPDLTVPAKPAFRVNDQITRLARPEGEVTGFNLNLEWSATDNSGVTTKLEQLDNDGTQYDIELGEERFFHVVSSTDYDGREGGNGYQAAGWLVSAKDSQRNSVTKFVPESVIVTQEDGVSYGASIAPITYTGSWATTLCECASYGRMRRTSALNASMSFTRTFEQGDHVAFVMSFGPHRGSARVLVDGVAMGTINTYDVNGNHNRTVAFDMMMSAGSHTVTLVNLATPGHPRIDLDAILVN
jgi:hypothetical protein